MPLSATVSRSAPKRLPRVYLRCSGGNSASAWASASAAAAAATASMRGSGTSLPQVPQIGSDPSSLTTTGSTTMVSHPGQIAVSGRLYSYGLLLMETSVSPVLRDLATPADLFTR